MPAVENDVRSDFIEMLGIVAQDDGMPRISGRIMGLLLFDGRPFSFRELADELGVSRGSISTNARFLLDRGVIQKTAKPGDRQDYFQISDNPYAEILKAVSVRAERTARNVLKVTEKLECGDLARIERLKRYADFYAAISEGIARAADSVSDVAP